MSQLKSCLLRLADVTLKAPPVDSPDWHVFWNDPQSAQEFFQLQSGELRYLRDSNVHNFGHLLVATARHLVELAGSVDSAGIDELQLLNCLRLLTKLLPFLFEDPSLRATERDLFWSGAQAPTAAGSAGSNSATVGSDSSEFGSSNDPSSTDSTKPNIDTQVNSTSSNDSTEVRYDNQSSSLTVPLGAQLVEVAVDLLFTPGFTLPEQTGVDKDNSELWEPGVGEVKEYEAPKIDLDSNRLEVLRFLHSACSQCVYLPVNDLVPQGSLYLTWLVTRTPKLQLLKLISSLVNITCRSTKVNSSSSANEDGLEFEVVAFRELRTIFVTHSIQLLTLMLVYPIPKKDAAILEKYLNGSKPVNLARYYCGRLYKSSELTLLIRGILNPQMRLLENSGASSSFSTWMKAKLNANEPSIWSVELLQLLWEFYQCNKKFRTCICQNYGPRLVVALLYNVWAYRNNDKYKSFVRLSAYMMLFLASDPAIRDHLLDHVDTTFYQGLPQNYKLAAPPTTYRDFLVSQICTIINSECPSVLCPTLVELLYNFVPLAALYTDKQGTPTQNRRISQRDLSSGQTPRLELSYAASSNLIQTVARLSNVPFLSHSTTNIDLLALLLRAICHSICRIPNNSLILLYVLSKSITVLENVHKSIAEVSDKLQDDPDDESSTTSVDDSSLSRQSTRESVVSQRIPPPAPFSSGSVSSQGSGSTRRSTLSEEEIELIQGLSIEGDDFADDPDDDEHDDEIDPLDTDIVYPHPPVGMSEHAKAKKPLNASLEETWPGANSLRIITKMVNWLDSHLAGAEHLLDASAVINRIAGFGPSTYIKQQKIPAEYDQTHTTFEPLRFAWSHLSLGWYEAMLWGSIYIAYRINKSKKLMNEITSSLTTIKRVSASWGFAGWNNTGNSPGNGSPESLSRYGSAGSSIDTASPFSGTGLDESKLKNMVENATVTSGIWSDTNVKLFRVSHKEQHSQVPQQQLSRMNSNVSMDSVADPLRRRYSQQIRRTTLPSLSPQTSHRDSVSQRSP